MNLILLSLIATLTVGCHRRSKKTEATGVRSGSAQSTNNSASTVATNDRTSKYRSDACVQSCCGGSSCKVTTENGTHAPCRSDSDNCLRCASGLTCIPGTCSAMLPKGETWELHASYIGGAAIADVCQSAWANAFVCLRASGNADWNCLPISDSCDDNGHGQLSMTVTTDDLVSRGMDIEVRSGSPQGPVVASRNKARYPTGIMMRALCTGVRFDHLTSAPGVEIDSFAFFFWNRHEHGETRHMDLPAFRVAD